MKPLGLKSTVTRHDTPTPPDADERQQQQQYHEQQAGNELPELPELPEVAEKPVKRNPDELQQAFLNRLLGKPCTIYLVGGIRLGGRLHSFDQFTILLSGPGNADQLVFKHAIASLMPGAPPPAKRDRERTQALPEYEPLETPESPESI